MFTVPNPRVLLYKDSPFIPKFSTFSAFNVMNDVTFSGTHPIIAVANEVKSISTHHFEFLLSNMEWLEEKFKLKPEDLMQYYFGLIMPGVIMIVVDMIEEFTENEALEILFPVSQSSFASDLGDYIIQNLEIAYRLIDANNMDPYLAVKKLIDHCRVDVYSDKLWYLVGLEAGIDLYNNLSLLFKFEEVSGEENHVN